MAVRRVCLRDGTNTTAGFEGECFMMAWYTGLAMDSRRVWVWLTLKPYTKEKENNQEPDKHCFFLGCWCISVNIYSQRNENLSVFLDLQNIYTPGCAAPEAQVWRWGGSWTWLWCCSPASGPRLWRWTKMSWGPRCGWDAQSERRCISSWSRSPLRQANEKKQGTLIWCTVYT